MNFIFDLDGTLVWEDSKKMYETYFTLISKRFNKKFGLNPHDFVLAMQKTMKTMDESLGDKNIHDLFFYNLLNFVSINYNEMVNEFNEFYDNEFDEVLKAYTKNEAMLEAVKILKSMGHKIIIATDPFLPKVPVDKKIIHGGFNLSDFDFISYNTNAHYVKSSPNFFEELFLSLNLNPKETIVVGNTIPTDIPSFEVKDAFILSESVKVKGETTIPYKILSVNEFLSIVKNDFCCAK